MGRNQYRRISAMFPGVARARAKREEDERTIYGLRQYVEACARREVVLKDKAAFDGVRFDRVVLFATREQARRVRAERVVVWLHGQGLEKSEALRRCAELLEGMKHDDIHRLHAHPWKALHEAEARANRLAQKVESLEACADKVEPVESDGMWPAGGDVLALAARVTAELLDQPIPSNVRSVLVDLQQLGTVDQEEGREAA